MMKRLVMVMLVSLMVLPLSVNAADFREGDREFTLSGGGTSDKNFDASSVSIEANFGYFTKNNLELLIRQKIQFVDTEGSSSIWDFSTRLVADYYLDMKFRGRMKPMKVFVGACVGYIYDKDFDGEFTAGPEVGLKYFFNDTTFATVIVAYNFNFEDTDDADDSFKDGRFDYTFGIGFKF